jgi:predicted DNA binding CopG/RHH family protein
MKAVQEFSDEQLQYASALTPEQTVQFLDDFRLLHAGRALGQGKSTQINVRVPEALLRVFRARAEAAGVAYQTQIKRLMEEWVRN